HNGPAHRGKSAFPAPKSAPSNLVLTHQEPQPAESRSAAPPIFLAFDVPNGGPAEAGITILADTGYESKFTIKPGELRRIRTALPGPVTRVRFQFQNAQHLRFDNLAYAHP